MRFCSSCGHELGVGRFCTNCGQPIDRSGAAPAPRSPLGGAARAADTPSSDTEERRAARRDAALTPSAPRTPPSANDTPVPPRFPLYADEVGHDPVTQPIDQTADRHVTPGQHAGRSGVRSTSQPAASTGQTTGQHAAEPESSSRGGLLDRFGQVDLAPDRTPQQALAALSAAADSESDLDDDSGRRRGSWVIAAVLVVVVVIALLVWLGTRDDSSDATDPSASGGTGQAAEPTDLASEADPQVPGTAPDANEAGGGTATFDAANMLDGDPVTAWRVAGNASGKQIVFTFPDPVTISQVGLINGYAKSWKGGGGKSFDWYHGNRTIAKVAWVFDDQTTLDQSLERNRRMQTLEVDDVTTKTMTLKIVEVRSPGTGRASRNFTAISDVSLVGLPAS